MIDLAAYERLQADTKALRETIHVATSRNDRVTDVGGIAWYEAPIPSRWAPMPDANLRPPAQGFRPALRLRGDQHRRGGLVRPQLAQERTLTP